MYGCTLGTFDKKKIEDLYSRGSRVFVFPLVRPEGIDATSTRKLFVEGSQELRATCPEIQLYVRAPDWITITSQTGELFAKSVAVMREQVELAGLIQAKGYIIRIGKGNPKAPHLEVVSSVVKAISSLDPRVPLLLEVSPGDPEGKNRGTFVMLTSVQRDALDILSRNNVQVALNVRNCWTQGDFVLVSLRESNRILLDRFELVLRKSVGIVFLTGTPEDAPCGKGTGSYAPTPSLLESKGVTPHLLKEIFLRATKLHIPCVLDRHSEVATREDLVTLKEWSNG